MKLFPMNILFCGILICCCSIYSTQDLNECVAECSDPTLQCTNTIGSYFCTCIDGYVPDPNGTCSPIKCEDIEVPCSPKQIELCNGTVLFLSAFAGYTTSSSTACPGHTINAGKPLSRRSCSLQGSWETAIWISSCDTGIPELSNQFINTEKDLKTTSSDLNILTSIPEDLNSNDVLAAIQAIDNILNTSHLETSFDVASSLTSVISNLMESPSLHETGRESKLISQLNELSSKIVLTNNQTYITVANNVSLIVTEDFGASEGVGVVVLERPDSVRMGFRVDQIIKINGRATAGDIVNKNKVYGSIHVPFSAVKKGSRVAIHVFGNANLFPRGKTSGSVVNSIIFSVTSNASISGLPRGHQLSFSIPIGSTSPEGRPVCAFWRESTSVWSEDGCIVDHVRTTNTSISCICEHLTNFATLLDLSGDDTNTCEVDDTPIIVGCSISTVALALVVAFFIFIPKTRSGRKFAPSFLLLNLSLALIGLNITLPVSEMEFITNPENYEENRSFCTGIAALLHVFLLSTCAWMNCEAVVLFFVVTKPTYTRTTKQVVVATCAWGWVIPFLYVNGIVLVDHTVYYYPFKNGDNEVTCWIRKDVVAYFAILPVGLTILLNLILYGISAYKLCQHSTPVEGDKFTRSPQKKIAVNICVVIVIGVTWTFGFISTVENEISTFAYIFAIFNSLQGIFLLFLYIVRNREVCESFCKKFSRLQSESADDARELEARDINLPTEGVEIVITNEGSSVGRATTSL